jgi:hypothetical protein
MCQAYLDLGEKYGMQKMWDYLNIVLHDPGVMGKDTFGAERLSKIYEGMREVVNEYHVAFTDDKEADYYQEKMDAQLRGIWGEKTLSFYERYPEVKRVKYDKARKGWN